MAAPGSLLASNRDVIPPQTCPGSITSGIGIDKLALSLPITRIVQDRSLWARVNSHWAEVHDALYMNASYHIKVTPVDTGLRCTVEYNPSRVVDPFGHSLCTTEGVFSTVSLIMNQLRHRVDLQGDVADALVTRLDVARDFRVSDPQFFLTGLRPLHRRNGANPSLWFDEKSGAASSLRVGTSRSSNPRHPNRVTLYDKHLKAGTPETVGVLRWELCSRSWSGRYGGIETLADLTPARVQALAEDRWTWSRMGEVVVSEGEFVDRVYSAEWSSDTKRDRFLGQYLGLSHGKRVLGESAREEFHRIQRRLGIAPSEKGGAARHLDLVTGTEVAEMSEAS